MTDKNTDKEKATACQKTPEHSFSRDESFAIRRANELASKLRDMGQRNGELFARTESLEGERDHYKAHADKLAEQLKQCLHMLPLHSKNPVVRQIITESWQTITAYESERAQ